MCATNRINAPDVAERILADGDADMVSMARPLLADPDFVNKAAAGRADEINTCIACNQACLDHVFQRKIASCLVNPRAGHETELRYEPAQTRKRFAVVGAGPAGLACATVLAERGHQVDLFDSAATIGGQFNLARRVPGKEEFEETLRYFRRRLQVTGVNVRLGVRADVPLLRDGGYDEVVLATGVTPRNPDIPGADEHRARAACSGMPTCCWADTHAARASPSIGAGGIGFDVAEFLVSATAFERARPRRVAARMGRDRSGSGAQRPGRACPATRPTRHVYLLQRKSTPLGKGLGKTTGWIHRAALRMKRVEMIGGVNYEQHRRARLARELRRGAHESHAARSRQRGALRRAGAAARPVRAAAERRASPCTRSAARTLPPNSTPSGRSTRDRGSQRGCRTSAAHSSGNGTRAAPVACSSMRLAARIAFSNWAWLNSSCPATR